MNAALVIPVEVVAVVLLAACVVVTFAVLWPVKKLCDWAVNRHFEKKLAQLRELAELARALAWYADEDNYDDEGTAGEWLNIPSNPANGGEEYDFEPDGGARARAALGLEADR